LATTTLQEFREFVRTLLNKLYIFNEVVDAVTDFAVEKFKSPFTTTKDVIDRLKEINDRVKALKVPSHHMGSANVASYRDSLQEALETEAKEVLRKRIRAVGYKQIAVSHLSDIAGGELVGLPITDSDTEAMGYLTTVSVRLMAPDKRPRDKPAQDAMKGRVQNVVVALVSLIARLAKTQGDPMATDSALVYPLQREFVQHIGDFLRERYSSNP
jgi:hypothetical protein